MTPDNGLKTHILDWCGQKGIPLAGIAPADRWVKGSPSFGIPDEFLPQSIFPKTRTVIVIGLPVLLPVLDTTPSIWYREHYFTINTLLDQYAYRLSLLLVARGFPAVPVPRDGYGHIDVLVDTPIAFFSHRHAAYFAGLGTFGTSNMLLTPQYGPRVRFASILTAADLPPDPVLEEQLCIRCMRCVRMCPAMALAEGEYPHCITDKHACAKNSAALNKKFRAPCGICIKVCPVGSDRAAYGRQDCSVYEDPDLDPALDAAARHVQRYGSL
jgi:epoxyqueuosine reductase QueG